MAIVTWWNEALEALSGEAYFLEARRRTAGQRLVACENLFNTYVRAVCGQQVNTAVAEKMATAADPELYKANLPYKRIYPIPSSEINANKLMEQNPGNN